MAETNKSRQKYKYMLDEVLNQKSASEKSSIKKRHKKVMTHNLKGLEAIKLLYTKDSLERVMDSQFQSQKPNLVDALLIITQPNPEKAFINSKYGDLNGTSGDKEQFKVKYKEKQTVCFYDRETFCETQMQDDKENMTYSPLTIWNNLKDQKNTNLIIIFGSPLSGKKGFLYQQKQAKQGIQLYFYSLDLGLLELSVQNMLEESSKMQDKLGQVLISIIGFVKDKVIDLLNPDQDLLTIKNRNLRIKREENNQINISNLIQMGVRSIEELQSIINLSQSLKIMFNQYLEQKIETFVFQISLAQMNQEKSRIQQILRKQNIVKITNSASNLSQTYSLSECLRQINSRHRSTDPQYLSIKNSKLTFYLEECFKQKSRVCFIAVLGIGIKLRDQIQIIKSYNSVLNQTCYLKHNYLNDPYSCHLLIEEDLALASSIIREIQNEKALTSDNQNNHHILAIEELKKYNLLDKNNKLNIILPRLQGHTESSAIKQRSRAHSTVNQLKFRQEGSYSLNHKN